MRDEWAHEFVSSIFALLPPWLWLLLAILLLGFLIVRQRRAGRRDREMLELIALGKGSVALSAKKRLKHPQMHGHYGEFVKEPEDDAWKPHGPKA